MRPSFLPRYWVDISNFQISFQRLLRNLTRSREYFGTIFFYPNRTICRLVLWYGHVCFPVFVTFRRNPSIAKSENDRAIPFERTNFFFFFLPNITRAGANFTDMKMRQKRTRRLQVLLYYFFSFFFSITSKRNLFITIYTIYKRPSIVHVFGKTFAVKRQ